MRGWLMSIITVSVISAVIGALSPEGECGRRHLRLVASLITVAVLSSPMWGMLRTLAGGIDAGDIGALSEYFDGRLDFDADEAPGGSLDALRASLRARLEAELRSQLRVMFGVPNDEISFEFSFGEGDSSLIPVFVCATLSGVSQLRDHAEIGEYLTSQLGCEAAVINGG